MRCFLRIVPALLLAAPLHAGGTWLHVRVTEQPEGEARVDVNVPLAAAELALGLLDDDDLRGEGIRVNGRRVTVEQLREMWRAVRDGEERDLLRVEDDGTRLTVARNGDSVELEATEPGEHGDRVRVELPVSVVDALLGHSRDRLDVQAALAELKSAPPGDLVTVESRDETVRVWID